MYQATEGSVPVWDGDGTSMGRPELAVDERARVCVVGGGIAGLTVAYCAARAGLSVVLVDAAEVASGQTGRTTAHLVTALDDRYYRLEECHGAVGARLAAESNTAAIDFVERTAGGERIDCGFARVDGYLVAPPPGEVDPEKLLARELGAARRAGVAGVTRIERAPVGDFEWGPALVFPNQGQFHPLRYMAGLLRACERLGVRVYGRTRVGEVRGGRDAHVTTGADGKGPAVRADAIVVATNTPINDVVAVHTKQYAYRTYAIGMELSHPLPPFLLWDGYWDGEEPYHYVRTHAAPDGRHLLIVGGEDHKTGQADDAEERYARLEEWARARFPRLGSGQFRWSGQVFEPYDGLAYIGRNPMDADNVFIATGDSGTGLTHGTIAGMLIGDLLMNRPNPWESLYAPSRKSLKCAARYLRENANTAAQYADWLTHGDVPREDEIPLGEGATVGAGLRKMAVYRDPHGEVHRVWATCPHLGGLVRWNNGEKTWDCPCHGSRFDRFGAVINGPAARPLRPVAPGPNLKDLSHEATRPAAL